MSLLILNDGFIVNKLSLSLDKACYSVFGAPDIEKVKINLKIGNINIQQVKYVRNI